MVNALPSAMLTLGSVMNSIVGLLDGDELGFGVGCFEGLEVGSLEGEAGGPGGEGGNITTFGELGCGGK